MKVWLWNDLNDLKLCIHPGVTVLSPQTDKADLSYEPKIIKRESVIYFEL